jgi:membrane fusion protein, multidrug efflux system
MKNKRTKNINFTDMNAYKGFIPVLILAVVFSCKPDKKAELAKLRKQHDEIAEQIKKLESEMTDSTIQKTLNVSVADLQQTSFQHYIEVQGKLDGEDYIDVSPEGVGVVEEVYAHVGQSVSKGQILARLNDAAGREQLKALETQYKLAKDAFEKQQRLWDQKIGSEMQYLQAKTNKEALESQLAGSRKQLDMLTIKSPIAGTVEEVNIKVGQMASAQNPVPPFRVINFSSIKVKAELAEAYAQKVNVGDNVLVYFPDLNREISAKVTTVSRYISPSSRTFSVEVRLNPDKNGLKANMVAVLKINDYKVDKGLIIPINYIQSDPNGNFVYVAEAKGNTTIAKKVFIEQGQSYNGMVEVLKGLKVGDKVITSGYLDLEEGERISF